MSSIRVCKTNGKEPVTDFCVFSICSGKAAFMIEILRRKRNRILENAFVK
ncbi:hypothetical protein D920_02220 [Enterococcus faecalis 13-SD-W-01]|nr:hypothetical protein D920_02220 [Enterococcus faecalis 13-SD-W-01]